jgi:hypothetical protein
VADERYFLGAVGLINSLRLVGHDEPIVVCDCGLSDEQRQLMGAAATIVDGPRGSAPYVLKAIAPRTTPADVSVLIDTDMIVTRPLTELIDLAAAGKVVAGSAELDRFVPEWGELLGLGPVRPVPYVSTGLVVAGGKIGRELVELVDERRDAVDFERTFWRRNDVTYPLLHADQDLINAVLAARAADDEIVVFDPRLSPSPPFAGLGIVDESTLRCAYADGTEPYVVHHWLAKPWLERTRDGVYSRLLRRLLVGEDLVINPPSHLIPHRFRSGVLAEAERRAINARERIRARLRRPRAEAGDSHR